MRSRRRLERPVRQCCGECPSAEFPGGLYYPEGSEPYCEMLRRRPSLHTGWLYHQGPETEQERMLFGILVDHQVFSNPPSFSKFFQVHLLFCRR
jgi:hypothetical protein